MGRDLDGSGYNNLIQHDAHNNPGNSGGPLLNLRGEVGLALSILGIQEMEGQFVQGLFFAVPSSTVVEIVDRLITDGEVRYPFFGITYRTITGKMPRFPVCRPTTAPM
ncbi:MAG: hypothetical protein R2839_07550 [Thermomicrobiales bacterium]